MAWNVAIGCGAAALAALVGAGWQIASRHAVSTEFAPLDVAMLRYVLPGALLAPLAWRAWPRARSLPGWQLALLVGGGGLPFGLLVLTGAQFAPAAHLGVFMAGAMPLFTAMLAAAWERETISRSRVCGLVLVAAGVAGMGWVGTGSAGSWRGDLLFLLAAAAWAAHTIAFRRSGFGAWEGAALCNSASALILLALLPFAGAASIAAAPAAAVLFQLAWQGLLAGLLGLVAYLAAVNRLGSSRASLSGAAVPLLTALGAFLVLGEPLHGSDVAAIALVTAGVVLASGALPFVPWKSSTTSSGMP